MDPCHRSVLVGRLAEAEERGQERVVAAIGELVRRLDGIEKRPLQVQVQSILDGQVVADNVIGRFAEGSRKTRAARGNASRWNLEG